MLQSLLGRNFLFAEDFEIDTRSTNQVASFQVFERI